MAINIKFDLAGNPEPPTILLSNRNGNIFGQLDVDVKSIEMSDKFNDASEFSFTLYKYVDDKLTNLWDKVVDFKLVYCKEWDEWFEISVKLDEATETIKDVFCTKLEKAELSQINLNNIEINTEADIERDDYKICILYDENDADASILNRCLKDKAPHYSIIHVDSTIAGIQRSFSFDKISIEDAFQEIAEEIGCLFVYHSYLDKDKILRRTISVYDLHQTCNNCGYRGEFTDICPKCNSKNITNGYGEDTLIFVTSDELASSGIELVADVDVVKNCFKLEAGDDLMTATVRNCNPNGTDYIWRFSEDIKEDMSEELKNKLESYDELYRYHYSDVEYYLDSELLASFNVLSDKYSEYNEDLQKIETPIKGYSSLMNAYYDTIDLALYLKSGLMPNIKMSKTTASEQASLLTISSLSPVAVADVTVASLATMNSVVLSMAKVIVKSTYKVQVKESETYDEGNKKYWKGNFTITNYSDEEDTAISDFVIVEINDDLEIFTRQQIEKALNKENTDDYSITGLFEKEYDEFCVELKKYALNPLISFHDACQSCINILIEKGIGSDSINTEDADLYENLYIPYYNKLMAIESEMKIREDEINIIIGIYDVNGNLITDGLQSDIEKCQIKIKGILDFEKYLGTRLWLEFCAYRREDVYSNENYISDGLNNAELFKKALEFFEVAENEIYKSSELQHSISTTLNNLLAIPKFKSLVKYFKVGNWIRVKVDDRVFKLRLLEYKISFSDFDNISVEFSDVTKIKNGITDVKNIMSQASSMATSYGYVKRQASQGEKSNSILNNWIENGLSATNTKIISADEQNQTWDKNGMLFREYDPITGTYGNEQLRIINSTIAVTDDNWKTTKTAIGKYYYIDHVTGEQKIAYGINGETIVGQFILGEDLSMRNESGSMVFDDKGFTVISGDDNGKMSFNEDGLIVSHGKNVVTISPKTEEVMNITNGEEKVFKIDENGELSINGNIMARSLSLESGVTIDSGVITNLATVATSGLYNDLLDVPTNLSDFNNDKGFITKDVSDLENYYTSINTDNLFSSYYKKTETDNLLSSKANTSDVYNKTEIDNLLDSKVNKSDVYNKTEIDNLLSSKVNNSDIDELKKWVLEQIELAMNQ